MSYVISTNWPSCMVCLTDTLATGGRLAEKSTGGGSAAGEVHSEMVLSVLIALTPGWLSLAGP